MTLLILFNITCFFILIKYLIDVQHLKLILAKEKQVVKGGCPKERKFMWIRGLY